MQRLYAIEFVCGGAMAGVFAVVFLWSLLPVARIESDLVLYVMVPLIAVYLPLNLLLAYLNRRSRRLRLPAGLSAKAFKRTSGLSFLVAVGVMVYGLYMWPYAAIKPGGTEYVDKQGRAFTQRQYETFRRWETAYMSAWGSTLLLALLALPFYRAEDHTHVFEGGGDNI